MNKQNKKELPFFNFRINFSKSSKTLKQILIPHSFRLAVELSNEKENLTLGQLLHELWPFKYGQRSFYLFALDDI